MKNTILILTAVVMAVLGIAAGTAYYHGKNQGSKNQAEALHAALGKIQTLEAVNTGLLQHSSYDHHGLAAHEHATSKPLPSHSDQGVDSVDTNSSIDRSIAELRDLHPEGLDSASYDLCLFANNAEHYADDLISDPQRLDSLLDAYINLNGSYNIANMTETLRVLSAQYGDFIQAHIMDKIIDNPDDLQQLEIYQRLSAISKQSDDVDALKSAMDRMNDPEAIVAAIDILKEFGSQQVFESDGQLERVDLEIDRYFGSQHDAVRKAALSTLRAHPRDDELQLINEALYDASLPVREEALAVIYERQINNPLLTEELLRIMRSDDSRKTERDFAYVSLSALVQTEAQKAEIDDLWQQFNNN